MHNKIKNLPTIRETLKKNKVKIKKGLGQNFLFDLKFLGISSSKFFQFNNLPKNPLIVFIPSSAVKTGNFGILIF